MSVEIRLIRVHSKIGKKFEIMVNFVSIGLLSVEHCNVHRFFVFVKSAYPKTLDNR